MSSTTVAALRLRSTGQTLLLRQDATLTIGRGSFTGITSAHVSRKQGKQAHTINDSFGPCFALPYPGLPRILTHLGVLFHIPHVLVQVISNANQITINRLGANRSLLDGKELLKDKPVPLHNGAILTLLEHEYVVIVEIPPIDASAEIKKENDVIPKGIEVTQSQTSNTPKSSQITSTTSEDGPPLEVQLQQEEDITPERTSRRVGEETEDGRNLKIYDSEGTSDSEDEYVPQSLQDSFDVSDESSIICSDISDLDGDRHVKDTKEEEDEHLPRGRVVIPLLD
ncbi:hypothetical protein BGZ65_007750 [Modicella reniformis]|uniref:FHA domain-containing protein n=1 Tax=Modicella reniformis TaxID=1440133 RepID=A0A9P6SSD1_9FUNG|nr:hypothetical protein BGZ65_007750 [Modicella reniformis]